MPRGGTHTRHAPRTSSLHRRLTVADSVHIERVHVQQQSDGRQVRGHWLALLPLTFALRANASCELTHLFCRLP